MEANLKSTLDGEQEQIAALMDQTQKKVGFNLGLRSLLTKQRQENRVQYNGQIAKMSDGEQKGEAEDAANTAQEKADEKQKDLDKMEDANKDKPEAKEAQDTIDNGTPKQKGDAESVVNKSEMPPDNPKSNSKSDDKPAKGGESKAAEVSGTTTTDTKAKSKDIKKAQVKVLDDKIKNVQAGIPKIKDKKAKETAKKTVDKLKDAKGKLGEALEFGMDPELFENKIWAINAVLEITKRKIDTDLYDNL